MDNGIIDYVSFCKNYVIKKLEKYLGKNEIIEYDELSDILSDGGFPIKSKDEAIPYLNKWRKHFDDLCECECASFYSPVERAYNPKYPLACCRNLVRFGTSNIVNSCARELLEDAKNGVEVQLTDTLLNNIIENVKLLEEIVF